MTRNILIKPKIALTIFEKGGKKYQYRPTITKMRKMLNSSLRSKVESSDFTQLKVSYGKFITNHNELEEKCNLIETNKFDDLKWAFEDFIDKTEWLEYKDRKSQKGGGSYEVLYVRSKIDK